MLIGISSWQPGISPQRLPRLEAERPAAQGAKQRVAAAAHVEPAGALIMPTREPQLLRLPQLRLRQPGPMLMRLMPPRRDRARPRPAAHADVGARAEGVAERPQLLQRLGLQKDRWLRHYKHRKPSAICGHRKAPATH